MHHADRPAQGRGIAVRLTDLLVFPIAALWQQKSRTALTTLGVVFGAFVLAASLSINHGVQETINRESHRTDALRRIHVHPQWGRRPQADADDETVVEGRMSEEKRRRIRAALALQKGQSRAPSPPESLSEESLRTLASLEHVESVEPDVSLGGQAMIDGQSQAVGVSSARARDPAYLRRLVAGRFFETPTEAAAVVSEYLLYRCGIVDDDAVETVLGKKLRIEIRSRRDSNRPSLRLYIYNSSGGEVPPEQNELVDRLNRLLPLAVDKLDLPAEQRELLKPLVEDQASGAGAEEVYAREFTIVGVIRQVTDEEWKERRWWDDLGGGSDVFLPCQTAADFFFRAADFFTWSASNRAPSLSSVTLIADDEQHVKQIVQQVKDLDWAADAPIEFIERERLTWRLVFGGMTCIAVVALLVAAMGIANTMLMNVLERTREIGIMKAVGAAGGHIQAIFLIEGTLIGAAGGSLGLLLAWGAAFPGDAWVRSMVERDMNVKLIDALFVFPSWLVATVLLFAVVVTTGAALYPARRAARVDPVAALRHE